MTDQDEINVERRRQAVLWNIRTDAATAEVAGLLAEAGVESVILKGPALSDWYPRDSARTYADGDIWVAPAAHTRATEVLRQLGFEPTIDEGGQLPGWWQDHANNWRRSADSTAIDLHRRLQGAQIDPALAWDRLAAHREQFELAGRRVWRLAPAGRAMYVTLNAAFEGGRGHNGITHLQMALAHAGDEIWGEAAALASKLEAADAFSVGLSLVEDGRQLAARLGVAANSSVDAAIRAASAPPVALSLEQLAGSAGITGRLSFVLRKFFPPPSFVRHWWPPARRNALMLAIGYLYRPFWIVVKAPAGWRAWRAARRQVAESQRDVRSSS